MADSVYLRKTFLVGDTIPCLVLDHSEDDDADVYVNGTLVSVEHDANAGPDIFNLNITPYLVKNSTNVIAVKATDVGGCCYWVTLKAQHRISTYYADEDDDGYGDPDSYVTGFCQPAGYVAESGDCNDHNAAVNPGAKEIVNGIDDDCNGIIDDLVVRYRGNSNDGATAITVDASGNVLVTGSVETSVYHESDYATIKYDANLNEIWVKRYGAEYNEEVANAMAIDASGSVYVTGSGYGDGTGDDYATVKYDAKGNEIWVNKYDGPENHFDVAKAIAVDALRNVYVTGRSEDETGADYATVKYDSNGNQVWVRRYNSPANDSDDGANAIAIDASGNVYVTGSGYSNETGEDYATVKYDASGNEIWVKKYSGTGNGGNRATAIAIDTLGNVYVAGRSNGDGTDRDFATVKYDSNGNEIWAKRYNGPGSSWDGVSAIAVDASGNVYVTGQSVGDGTRGDYATIKYDAKGNEIWVKRYNGPGNGDDYASAMAIDAPGNVYVTGWSEGNGYNRDYATVKYDANGNEIWVYRYNGPANSYDEATAIAVDASGSVCVTGRSWNDSTYYDYATIKYAQTPAPGSRPSIVNNKPDKNKDVSIKLAPNPARNILKIYTAGLQQNKQTTISVISSSGVVMKTIQSTSLNKTIPMEVSSLPAGVYIIKLMSGDKVVYKEFVKI